MTWEQYIVVGMVLAGIIFAGGALALSWAIRNGQFSQMENASTSIFDEDEPLGQITDRFPQKRRKRTPGKAANRSTHS